MIYLDNNATTPVDSRVLEQMLPFFTEHYGNAASRTHQAGWYAEGAVESAREKVAELLGCEKQEIIFTSGATEAINIALTGIAKAYVTKGKHIITSRTEHKAVLDVCSSLENEGYEISFLDVDREGRVDVAQLRALIRKDTIAVAVMLANNETGTIQDIAALSEIAHTHGAVFFSDTTQAAGKIRMDVNELGIDVCCISAHKFGGPKGVGALFIRRKNPRVTLLPLLHGGGHERGLRPGTLNVPGIVGLGAAAEFAVNEMWEANERISKLRTFTEQFITEDNLERDSKHITRGFINGCIRNRLPNTSNILLKGIRAHELIKRLPNIAISTGSACTSADDIPSHVLRATGLSEEESRSCIRISIGKQNTEAELLEARQAIRDLIDQLYPRTQ
jgi:cysteine desulfurase